MDVFRQLLRGAGRGDGGDDGDGENDQLLLYEDYTSSEEKGESEDEEGTLKTWRFPLVLLRTRIPTACAIRSADVETTASEGKASKSSYDISLPARHLVSWTKAGEGIH